MPAFGPISRDGLIRTLRELGFTGPYSGGKHEFMLGRGTRLILPNPHRSDIGRPMLTRLLRQANISREEWESI